MVSSMTASAAGLRQMLPRQTKRILTGRFSARMERTRFARASRGVRLVLSLIRQEWLKGWLFSLEDFPEGGEFVEGLERGEVVDVKAEQLVTDLAQDGVVELEEAELHPGLGLRLGN